MKIFIKAILAGMMIAFGGIVYLSVENKGLGSFLFAMGLFTVLTSGLYLFTGKIGFFVENPTVAYARDMGITLAGNLFGTVIMGLAMQLARGGEKLFEAASAISKVKIGDNLLSLFILAVCCGIMMFLASDIYKRVDGVGRYLAVILPVMVFIMSGFEHSVANMFYFTMGGAWGLQGVINTAVVVLGNSVGALLFCYATRKAECFGK